MFKPLSLFIGLRYTRAKRRTGFISFISLVSVIGIALSIMVLITVLSVMNGFDQQIRNKIASSVAHITITNDSDNFKDWQELKKKLATNKNILAMAPYIEKQGLLSANNTVNPAFIIGILPNQQKYIDNIQTKIVAGSFAKLNTEKFSLALSENMALHLGLGIGDKVNLITPQTDITPLGVNVRMRAFTVVAIFKADASFALENNSVFVLLSSLQKLFIMPGQVSGLRLKIANLLQAPIISEQIQKKLGYQYQVSDWTNTYGGFYHAVQMEKTAMFFVLILLVAIAVFNLVSSLVMLVNDKKADIAILRTFGATPQMICNVFIIQGLIIGLLGIIFGASIGILLALTATKIVNFIQVAFNVVLITPGAYWVDYLPSQLQWLDVIKVVSAAFILSLLATVYPALRAARLSIIEALRYE